MARPLRIHTPDGTYHVTSRGLERRAIVLDDYDREKWVSLLDRVAQRRDWRVFAWVLMDNHFHLFLRTPHADLSDGMHDLNSGYVTTFNRRHGRCGPLFQGRFKGILVEQDHHYWELSRYIHLNPVRAGVTDQPDTYPWSSCRFYFRGQDSPDWLAWEEVLNQHGRTVRAARREYRRLLFDGIASPPQNPLRETVASTLLGSPGFVDRMKSWLEDRLPDRDVPAANELRREVSISEIEDAVCSTLRVSSESLRVRGKKRNEARAIAVYMCRALTRIPVTKIGEHFGGIKGAAICNCVARITQERNQDEQLDSKIRAVERAIKKNEQ